MQHWSTGLYFRSPAKSCITFLRGRVLPLHTCLKEASSDWIQRVLTINGVPKRGHQRQQLFRSYMNHWFPYRKYAPPTCGYLVQWSISHNSKRPDAQVKIRTCMP
ncbi:hypothetical protein CDV36_007529 [Fusarium kuroshium]|uniref:Uncharacterized protein n=1 Tax=Fusarium kuroshium TaxID=2010991 RepID=A0A3M2S6R5_9HYPO|nr:hypothetical protein CDV36_007529 [Fusarium kuroshium]